MIDIGLQLAESSSKISPLLVEPDRRRSGNGSKLCIKIGLLLVEPDSRKSGTGSKLLSRIGAVG